MMEDYRYQKACQLERKLGLMLGTHPKKDWLMEYRKWLDANDVEAETDGYPSTQAHDDHNIRLFVASVRRARLEVVKA